MSDRTHMNRAIISMRITIEHDRERLGPHHGLDATGSKLLHDLNNALTYLVSISPDDAIPSRAEFSKMLSQTMALHERVTDYVTDRREVTSHELTTFVIYDNQEGPRDSETLVSCPACHFCPLCRGYHMVSVTVAEAYLEARRKS